MEALVGEGLVRHIGLSNFTFALLQDLLGYCKIKPLCMQSPCNPYLQNDLLIHVCLERQIHFVAYSPLGGAKQGSAVK